MREYIVNLTTNLISLGQLNIHAESWQFGKEGLPAHIYCFLMRNVLKMSPQTLGKILCSLEPSDVRYELPLSLKLPYDFSQTLPEIVGWCLACAIADRLDTGPNRNKTVPVYLTPPTKDPRSTD